jgi:hypothetical protein
MCRRSARPLPFTMPPKWRLPWPADVPTFALEQAHQNSIHLATQARREIKHDLD